VLSACARVLSGLSALSLLALPLLPAVAAAAEGTERPARSSSASGVWTTSSEHFRDFVATGAIKDRGLSQLIDRSGWTPDELRAGFSRTYRVRLEAVAQFLSSEAGVLWLRNQTRSYTPFASLRARAPEALRSAILADAADGSISASGIVAALPTDFRLTRGYGDLDGTQNVCAVARCEDPRQCTSLLSWFYFLPACIQANASVGLVDAGFSKLLYR